jgi:starch phosphorylase
MTLDKATAGKPVFHEADRDVLARNQRDHLRVGETDSYDRHVVLDHAVSLERASHRERFEAVARSLRDLLTQRWLLTEQTYERANAKRVYYLSMEFLIGRTLIHNIINMGVEQLVRDDLRFRSATGLDGSYRLGTRRWLG